MRFLALVARRRDEGGRRVASPTIVRPPQGEPSRDDIQLTLIVFQHTGDVEAAQEGAVA